MDTLPHHNHKNQPVTIHSLADGLHVRISHSAAEAIGEALSDIIRAAEYAREVREAEEARRHEQRIRHSEYKRNGTMAGLKLLRLERCRQDTPAARSRLCAEYNITSEALEFFYERMRSRRRNRYLRFRNDCIRRLRNVGVSPKAIAERYGLSVQQVYNVIRSA